MLPLPEATLAFALPPFLAHLAPRSPKPPLNSPQPPPLSLPSPPTPDKLILPKSPSSPTPSPGPHSHYQCPPQRLLQSLAPNMPGKEEPPAAWILSKSSTVSLHSMSERSNVDSGNLSSLSAKPTVYATSPAVVTKLHVCYRICRWLMPCWSQAQIHEIDQSLHSFHNQVADMVEGETALHHYPEGDKMKAKYRGHEGVVVLDEETGETIDIVDNKNPSPEEIAHYKLAQVASKPVDFQESLDFFAHHDSESQRESGDVAKLSSSSGPGELPKRRITWRRTDSMDDIPQGGLVYKRPSKVDKSVRIFPLGKSLRSHTRM